MSRAAPQGVVGWRMVLLGAVLSACVLGSLRFGGRAVARAPGYRDLLKLPFLAMAGGLVTATVLFLLSLPRGAGRRETIALRCAG
jgi:hypothetical protein